MAQVKCYGCGGQYDAANEAESTRHTHHLGDSGLSREKLLEMVNELQAERDEALRVLGPSGQDERDLPGMGGGYRS